MTPRRLRLLGLAAAAFVVLYLFRAAARDVTLVYDLSSSPDATGLEVDIRRGAEMVRHAEFRLHPPPGQVRHQVRLPDGDYDVALRVARPEGAFRVERPVEVRESGTIVLAVSR